MSPLNGKYELIKSENFAQYLISLGLSEEIAKVAETVKPVINIKHEGDKIIVDLEMDKPVHVEYTLGQEVDETLPFGVTLKSVATLEGSTLTVVSKTPKGKTSKRIHKLNGDQVEITYYDGESKTAYATRVFKKI